MGPDSFVNMRKTARTGLASLQIIPLSVLSLMECSQIVCWASDSTLPVLRLDPGRRCSYCHSDPPHPIPSVCAPRPFPSRHCLLPRLASSS